MAEKFDGKNLSLTVDGVEFNADGTSVVMDNEDGDTDTQTFADLNSGTPVQWFFAITAITDLAAATFWRLLWDNAGDDLAFVFKPYGNAVVTVDKPHFTGTCTVTRKPPVGGSAGTTWTYDARLDIIGEPTMDATP